MADSIWNSSRNIRHCVRIGKISRSIIDVKWITSSFLDKEQHIVTPTQSRNCCRTPIQQDLCVHIYNNLTIMHCHIKRRNLSQMRSSFYISYMLSKCQLIQNLSQKQLSLYLIYFVYRAFQNSFAVPSPFLFSAFLRIFPLPSQQLQNFFLLSWPALII